MKFLLTILLGSLMLPIFSQVLFFRVGNEISRKSDVFKMDFSNCNCTKVCTDQVYVHFAIRPKANEWISLEWVGIVGWYNMNFCQRLNWGGTIIPTYLYRLENGQASDKYGNIWLIGGSGILKVNPPNLTYEYKGPLDSTLLMGISWSTFLNGKAYSIATFKSDPTQEYIIEIDSLITTKFRIISRMPSFDTIGYTSGLFSLYNSCGDNQLVLGTESKFYNVDLVNGGLNLMCQFNLPPENRKGKSGASPWLYDPLDCDVFLDLDINNNSGEKTNGFNSFYKCSGILPVISDADLDVFSDYGTMDSIIIQILNPYDGIQERILYYDKHSIKSIRANNYLKLEPFGNANNDSFELAIQSMLYENLTCLPTTGNRFIQFVVFKNGISDTAICNLFMDGPFYNAGLDTSLVICKDAGQINLYPFLGPCYSPGGIWSPILNIQGQYDPNLDIDSIYYYVVGDSICGYDSAKIAIKSIQILSFKLPGDTVLCEGDVLQFNYNLPGINLLWNDGTINGQKTIASTGLYWLQLINQFGCSYRDSMFIEFKPISKLHRIVTICENERFEYKSQFYQVGDLVRDTIRHSSSCDSLIEIELLGIPVPAIKLLGDTLICPNTQSLIQTVQNFSKYYWSTQDSSVSQLLSPGYYTLQVTDSNGCSNFIAFNIRQSPEIKYELKVNDPLCEDDNGSILFKLTSGGIFPIRYLINGQENRSGTFNQLNSGLYIAQIIDSNNCSTIDTVQINPALGFEIEMIDQLELEFGSTTVLNYKVIEGTLKQIRVSPDSDIIQYGNSGFQIIGKEDTNYEFQFEDSNGCIIIKALHVKIKQNNELFIPTAFTPNGDQINDLWEPWIAPASKLIIAKIFNRWGEIVYISKTEVKWDGRFKDSNCSPGVYIYYLEIQQGNKNKVIKSGDFTLVR